MLFSKLETFLEKHIEGFFGRKFVSDLQFSEIEKNIAHIMKRDGKKTADKLYIPNNYQITMAASDYERICSRKSQEMLYEYIVGTVMRQNLFIKGPLSIKFNKDTAIKKGDCDIKYDYMDEMTHTIGVNQVSESTIIIKKPGIKETALLHNEHYYARLRVIDGEDISTQLDIGEGQVHIGRREENEFLLTDGNASRVHAYISFSDYRHMLHDCNSLNGTFINDKRIAEEYLKDNDVITIGNSRLVYEVF